jgi:hypothetical protein
LIISAKCFNLNGVRLPFNHKIANAIILNDIAKTSNAAIKIGLSLFWKIKNEGIMVKIYLIILLNLPDIF